MEAVEEALEHGSEDGDEGGDGDSGEDCPDDEGVPLPGPEQAGGRPGVMADGVEERVAFEREAAGVEEDVADLDEDEEERDLERVDEVVGDLRGDQVKTQDERDGEAEEGGGAEQGIDADHKSGGEGPGEFARRAADAEEFEDRLDEAALEKRGVQVGLVCPVGLRDGGGGHSTYDGAGCVTSM